MPPASKPKSSRVKVSEHRRRLRAQGLRPIQIWVPDMRAPSFRKEAHKQSAAVAANTAAMRQILLRRSWIEPNTIASTFFFGPSAPCPESSPGVSSQGR